jgi:2-C-methyl-D-erythritol 2,4-cyclodiphosphate synthase
LNAIRIGLGYDIHRLAAGGPLRLGGIELEYDKHAVGHSDADVLLHAVTDALLGAVNLGDIGEMFPNTAVENRNRNSGEMLTIAWQRVQERGFQIANLDCVVHAQAAKILPARAAIQERIAELLHVPCDAISVKGKTGEEVGPIGREEAISAQCVALLVAEESGFLAGEDVP